MKATSRNSSVVNTETFEQDNMIIEISNFTDETVWNATVMIRENNTSDYYPEAGTGVVIFETKPKALSYVSGRFGVIVS